MSARPDQGTRVPRYEVGCAGQYIVGGVRYFNDVDEAIAAAEWPAGATVFDRVTRSYEHTPLRWEDINAAKARLNSRAPRDERTA